MLDDLNEGLILHNIKQRFFAHEIYSAVGTILIAVNPFQRLPIYGAKVIDSYKNRGNHKMKPHPFLVAAQAFEAIFESDGTAPQSILVSGESGAGKTETTKQCLT